MRATVFMALGWLFGQTGCGARTALSRPAAPGVTSATEERAAFETLVAAEPPSDRLTVVRVDPAVLAGPDTIFALAPTLTAFRLSDGVVLWAVKQATGGTLYRVGRRLATQPSGEPVLVFVDPENPKAVSRCTLALPAPPSADQFWLHPFDRGGRTYVHWESTKAVPPMGEPNSYQRALNAASASRGCGLVSLDLQTCAVASATLPHWNSAKCSGASPTLLIPAAAAAEPPPAHGAARVERTTWYDQGTAHTEATLVVTLSTSPRWERRLSDTVTPPSPP